MDNAAIKKRYDEALAGLAANCKTVKGCHSPVLFEGGCYQGIWLECAPLESLVYGKHAPDVARATHDAFFQNQREDGYLPCIVSANGISTAQIQMVVPIAATALETADLSAVAGSDRVAPFRRKGAGLALGERGPHAAGTAVGVSAEAFLAKAYDACSRWDGWLSRNRNTRGTGLCELFCQFDSGHDGSPRLAGLPEACPDEDAAICPDAGKLPYLAPDLSATVYGGRVALATMAERLGKSDEAEMWREKAETIRRLIIKHCFDPEDECFYDVDAGGEFIRIRGDVLTRVFSEHVVDQTMFDRIYERHIKNPDSFWTPYPLPSIAAGDPAFVKRIPINSWGGASQALTALRTPRWFYHYGKSEDHRHLMTKWVEAIVACPHFMQQINPWTGEFTESKTKDYSPAMCVLIDFVDRLGLV